MIIIKISDIYEVRVINTTTVCIKTKVERWIYRSLSRYEKVLLALSGKMKPTKKLSKDILMNRNSWK